MKKKEIVLFVTHTPKQCGVYEFGKNVFNVLTGSSQFEFIKAEYASREDLDRAIQQHRPSAIIYNYHPSVLPWLCTKVAPRVYRNNITGIKIIQVGIVHEITQFVADSATAYRNKYFAGSAIKRLNALFDFYIAPDPTLLLKNPLVFKTGRLIPEFHGQRPTPTIPTIGSFGFATPRKGFQNLVELVNREFDEAVIRINMPSADFGDPDGSRARKIANECKERNIKPGIRLEITHDYLSDEALRDFLAANSINAFLYEDTGGRGISSAIDNALAVHKPIAVSNCPMFRHILGAQPSICIENLPLKTILANGFGPLETISSDWNAANLLWEYERILTAVFQKAANPVVTKMSVIRTIKSRINRMLTMPDQSFTWLRNTNAASDDDMRRVPTSYQPVTIPPGKGLNRILDDSARELYKPAEQKLLELVPHTMAKKIKRANVQQAFVFDTVYRYISHYENAKMLCVGSYEDTASMALIKMGYNVREIDPMINYYLQEFYTKPDTKKNYYNIIFSTSVIEHDPDDESFMKCVAGLLAPGGVAVITCDYKDGWKPGDLKPPVDARLYTKQDMEQRLLSYTPDCDLVDPGDWDCPDPDFNFLGKYQYTFATYVIRKRRD